MYPVNKKRQLKCPYCGGKGVLPDIYSEKKYTKNSKIEKTLDEYRLPDFTGTKDQCCEAMNIRTKYVQQAKRRYNADQFGIFIKLISYESHALFWINHKECNLTELIGKIAVKNPTAFELINLMR